MHLKLGAPDDLVNDKKALDRFIREARAASQLNHPGICTIYDIEEMNGLPFIVMEKLDGVNLKESGCAASPWNSTRSST